MKNQFGQDIEVGDWVGYASKTGSVTDRKVGVVTGFGVRNSWNGSEDVAFVNWRLDGSWGQLRHIDQQGNGVGINRLFRLKW